MENKKSNFWEEMGKPFVVLVVICLVASFLLGVANDVTKPVIEANAAAAAEATRKSVLPTATSFTEVAVPAGVNADSIFVDDGGSGYVITSSVYGYHGNIPVTIGFDADGKVVALSANVSSETQGVGSRAGQASFLDKFVGLSGSADSVDTLTSATYSSTAVRQAVSDAMAALDAVK